MSQELEAVIILEKDVNNDLLTTWVYPAVEAQVRAVAEEHATQVLACLTVDRSQQAAPAEVDSSQTDELFIWTKYKTSWLYVLGRSGGALGGSSLKGVTGLVTVVLTSTFNPEKYAALTGIFSSIYSATASPPKMLEAYLSVFLKGKFSSDLGAFQSSDYDPRKALLVTSIKDVISMLGLEIILVWSALMMKKRIAVYSNSLSSLLHTIRAFPILVWHRQDWGLLRAWVNITDNQLQDLQQAGVYIAGFTDPAIKGMQHLYDVIVDLETRSVRVSEHSVGEFRMGIFHKELATWLVEAADDADVAPQALIKDLALRTKDLLTKLAALRVDDEDGNKYITLEPAARKLPPHMDRFLYNVAGAESMTKNTSV